ncbi:rod shape-determining protein MreD [Aerococcaceae bacterium NML201209]|nr:rod shape-determining protein MreD [Aerococcaceae bacterium NML201209]MCW6677396.1 rod shape-determining protein MreD [Aerococcaceae bacterium NML180378]MDO4775160.1 rod shape-determining protein MreD [Aerococcaceae bacterium]
MKFTRRRDMKWFVPVILFIGVIIDAALPAVFPKAFLGGGQTVISHFALFYLVTIAFYFRDSNILLYSFLFGLLTDAYNTTFLGLYAAIYFIVAYTVHRVKRFFPKKPIIHWMLFILAITFVDFVVFVFYRETGQTTMILTDFVVSRLTPTLIYNTVLTFILYLPTKHLLKWLGYETYIIF